VYEIICSYGMGKNTQNTCIDERVFKYYLDSIKDEVSDMIKETYERAVETIRENKQTVEKVAEYLIKNETMNAEQLDELMEETKKKKALV
jgi:ATP-dependent Zn protease